MRKKDLIAKWPKCRALAEVKTKVYKKPEVRLDDTQALDALVSCFRNAEKGR